MASRLAADAPEIAAGYPWGRLRHVVDVGGGNGSLLIAILQAHLGLYGTVLDLGGPVTRAARAITEAGLDDRADARVGSFFEPLPVGAGGYVLSGILHDWDDADAARILSRCVEAGGAQASVLVVDHVDSDSRVMDTEGDLRMLCYCRGRERSLDQLGSLAGSVGLTIDSVTSAGLRSVVELRAASSSV